MTHTPHAAGGLAQIIDTASLREGIRTIQDASLQSRLLTLCNGYDMLLEEQRAHHGYLERLRNHLAHIQVVIERWVDEETTPV